MLSHKPRLVHVEISRPAHAPRVGLAAWCVVLSLLLGATGCEESIDSSYGRMQGNRSLAGTGVLASLFRQNDCQTENRRVLTPKLAENSDVIVWFPDDQSQPKDQVIEWLEAWLDADSGRKLVYVPQGYVPLTDYWRDCIGKRGSIDQDEELQQRILDYESNTNPRHFRAPLIPSVASSQVPQWFSQQPASSNMLTQLRGPWAQYIDSSKLRLRAIDALIPQSPAFRVLLESDEGMWAFSTCTESSWSLYPSENDALESPPESYAEREDFTDWPPPQTLPFPGPRPDDRVNEETIEEDPDAVEVVIEADEYRLSLDRALDRQQIIVVVNGSFLLNYGLVNQEHRKLALHLVNEIGPNQRVTFLESGSGGPKIAEKDPEAKLPMMLELFQIPRLGVSLLHLAVLAICFCYWKLPQLGRPQGWQDDSDRDFGQHIGALAGLLRRSRQYTFAADKLAEYRRLTEPKSKPSEPELLPSEENKK